jgi:hypothetical protein
MPNSILTPTEITKEALMVLHQESTFLRTINRDYDDRFAKSGASVSGKIGPTLQVRDAVQFTVRTGAALSVQDVIENKKDLTVSTLKGVDWEFSDVDLSLSIDRFRDRYLKPAMARLAAEIEYDALSMYNKVPNFVGTPGTTPQTYAVWGAAGQKLDEALAPRDGNWTALISPAASNATVDGLKALFNPNPTISDNFRKGVMGDAAGFTFRMSSIVRNHQVGPLGGTPLVNGANQGLTAAVSAASLASTSLVTDGWTASAALRLRAGDIITIAGVFDVHPETKEVRSTLKQFTVLADASSDGSGNATISIYPAIISGGAYQTVSARPADNVAITVVTGTAATNYQQNLCYHRDAFTLATADLEVPNGMDMAAREQFDGISLRFVRGYDINNNKRVCRFDILYGYLAQRPEWACRVTG